MEPLPYIPGDGDKAINAEGYVKRHAPVPGAIQKLFQRWLESRGNQRKSLPYPFWAAAKFGVLEAIARTWKFHAHPHHFAYWLKRQKRKFDLVDRRKKKSYSKTVYAVDRDGDLFLVECPKCHDTQHLIFNRDNGGRLYTKAVPECAFQCFPCDIGFWVHLEDGLRDIKDHRDGVPPLPSVVVWDDRGTIHLGIAKDAPWWWTRREICRDLRPNGMDAHEHKYYEIFPTVATGNGVENCGNSCPPETEQPS